MCSLNQVRCLGEVRAPAAPVQLVCMTRPQRTPFIHGLLALKCCSSFFFFLSVSHFLFFISILNLCFFSFLFFFSLPVASSLCNRHLAKAPTPSLPADSRALEEPVAAWAPAGRRAISFFHHVCPPLLPFLFPTCPSEGALCCVSLCGLGLLPARCQQN